MSDADETPEAPAEPVKVKQVAISAGLVSAALAAAVAFTVGGPLGVGIAAAGVAGTGYAAHRIRNPRRGTLLHSWLTRTRRAKTTSTKGSLTWPFTGSQSRRALSRSGGSSKRGAGISGARGGSRGIRSGSPSRKTGTTTGRASGGRLLPKTTRSRAATSAGGVLPKHQASRPVARRTPVTRSASKPIGTRTPKTASRTPAKASRRPSLVSGTSTGRRSVSGRKLGTQTRRGPLSPGRKSSGTGGLLGRRSSLGPKATTRKGLLGRIGRPTSPTRGRSSTTGRGRGRWNPFLGTRGGQSLGRRSTDTRRTRRANRLGGTLTGVQRRGPLGRLRHRVTPDRNRSTIPNRTSLRPRPYARRTTGQLLRTSLRVPKRQRGTYGSRNGWRPYVRPTAKQAKRARRTLRLRSGVWLRRGAVWIAKTPARRWDRLWDRLPKAPLPLTHYTERAGMKVPSGPKATTKPNTPAPTPPDNVVPINRKALQAMSNPTEVIVDAFQQLAAFQPESAREVEQFLQQQQEMLSQIGQSYGVLSDRMRDGMPFAAPVADSVREIGVALASVGGIAQSAHQTLRVAHEADIRRYEDPRPGEDMWNPEKNR